MFSEDPGTLNHFVLCFSIASKLKGRVAIQQIGLVPVPRQLDQLSHQG